MTEWNDDRLDELNGRVKSGFIAVGKRFEQVDKRFVRLEGEMKGGFAKVDKRFDQVATRESVAEVNARLDRFETRVDRFYYTFLVVVVALVGNLIANGAGG